MALPPKKLSELPAFQGSTLDSTAEFPVNQNGQTWRASISKLPAGLAPERKTVVIQSTSSGRQVGQVLLSTLCVLLKMQSTGSGRLRLYTTISARDADVDRPIGGPISQSTGLLFEGVTNELVSVFDATPVPTLANGEEVPTKNIPFTIDPAQGTNYTITLTYLELQP